MTDETKIKLLIFIPGLQCGGSEKFVWLLCNHINTQKFSVCLVVLNNTDPFYKINNPAITVIDLKEKRVRYTLFKIKREIKEIQPDIVFSTANHLNLYFAIFRNWLPKTIKFIARESSIVSINSRRATMPAIYNRLIKKYYRRFDLIVCQSVYMQQDLINNYHIPENKTIVIHNATEEILINHTNQQDSLAENKIYKFITVARLSEEKGIERLIHAVGLLSFPFQFYIIGEGEKRAYLQKLIHTLQLEEKVFLKGESNEPFKGMEDADLFLMGSYYEGFPNVLLEAGAIGIPVIAFDVPGGIAEIITAVTGILVDDNDLIGFAAAIQMATDNLFDRNKIIALTKERFSVHTIMTGIENLFRLPAQPNN